METLREIRIFISKASSKRFCVPMSIAVKHSELCNRLERDILEMEKNLSQVLEENQKLNEKLQKNSEEKVKFGDNTKVRLNSKVGESSKFKEILKTDDNFSKDLQNFLLDENFTDFSIKINEETFKVHKFVLAARSSVFAEMIKNNIEASSLELLDIPVEIFKIILDFIYFDKIPENFDSKNIFIASGRLNIKVLKELSGRKLIETLNAENALDFFTIANKYNHEELKKKSFEKIQSMFPGNKIKPELIDDPEKMKEYFNERKTLSEMIEKFKEKFEVGC
jgi:hypothetical protein